MNKTETMKKQKSEQKIEIEFPRVEPRLTGLRLVSPRLISPRLISPRLINTVLAVCGLAFASSVLSADTEAEAPAPKKSFVMHLETTDHGGSEPRVEASTMVIAGGRLKMDLQKPGADSLNHTMVFSGSEKPQIAVINHRDKSFLIMDPESISALGNEMQAAMAEARQQIANLPPEQQAIMQKVLDAQLKGVEKPDLPVTTVMKTSERETLQGFPCVRYDVFREGEKIREVWVTSWSKIGGGREALGVLQQMSDFSSDLMESFEKQAAASFGGGFAFDNHPFADLQQMDGFPVMSRNFEQGSLKTEIVLQSAEQQMHDPAAFEPPAGYRRTTLGPR